jgi:iron complex transport system substrate-binding protein
MYNYLKIKQINFRCRWLFLMTFLLGVTVAGVDAAQFQIQSPGVIIDQGGRTLKIDKAYERIISLYGAHTENLFSLGLSAEIIGVSPHEVYPPRALQKPVFSYHDDPEKFLATKPDLVLIRPMIDRGYPQLVRRLEKSGITVVSLQPGTMDEMFDYWEILGILTGRRQRALELADHFGNVSQYLHKLTGDIEARKRVYFEAIHSRMKTFSPDSMAIFTLQTAGGINVAADAKPVRKTNIAFYGKERILAHAAEIDVYLAQYGAMNTPTVAMIRKEPGYRAIKAIRDNEIYIIDEHIVSRPTVRLLDGILEIGKILYPDRFGAEASKVVQSAKQF